jgi:hypothetical protein
MASDLHDPVGRALDDLRSDVAPTSLPSPAEIRARGDQRARRQRAALGAGTVVAIAAIAVGTTVLPDSLQSSGRMPVPPAGGTLTATASPSRTATPSGSPTTGPAASGRRTVIDVTPVGVGTVPRAYFLPGTLWSGADLVHGAKIRTIEPKEFEGSVQRFQCDPDAAMTGDVAFVQAAKPDGTFVGTQKVRLLADPASARTFTTTAATAITACQQHLRDQAARDAADLAPGETAPVPSATVTESEGARVDDATGSVRLFTTITDYGTGAGSQLVEWVVLAREGAAVTLISINQFEDGDVSFGALQRIAGQARQQMAWAATQK